MRTLLKFLSLFLLCAAVQPTVAHAANEVWVKNECERPMRFFLRHAPADEHWINSGWWRYSGGEKLKRLMSGGRPLLHLPNHHIYAYGEVVGSDTEEWSGNDLRTTFNGRTYRLRKLSTYTDDDGDTQITFTCSGGEGI